MSRHLRSRTTTKPRFRQRPCVEEVERRLLMAAQPVISEFMASNDHTLADSDGDYSDWIEVHNPDTAASLDISGYYLANSAANLTKWRFPATTTIPADGYLVVFASNKNRAVAGQQLHTNFKLSADGEYLGLVKPDGTTIVSQYAPTFPAQQQDVSYGIPSAGLNAVPLTGAGSALKYTIPTSGPIDPTWNQASFNDSSWTAGTNGIGYEAAAPLTLPNEVENNGTTATANNTAGNFSVYSGNLYHLLIRGEAGTSLDVFNVGAMQLGDVLSVTVSATASLRGTSNDPGLDIYRWNNGSPVVVATDENNGPGTDAVINKFTVTTADTYYVAARGPGNTRGTYEVGITLENAGAAPNTGSGLANEDENAGNNTPQQPNDVSSAWRAVQYVSTTAGTITAGDQDDYKFTLAAGDVVSFLVDSADGAASPLDARLSILNSAGTAIATDDGTSVVPSPYDKDAWVRSFVAPAAGTYYAQVYSTGAAGGTAGAYTLSTYLSTNTPPSNASVFGGLISTNVQAAMRNVNSSAFVRLPFTYNPTSPTDALTLAVKYDDGFVAYLNGTEVARRNAPGTAGTPLAYNAAASAAHDNSAATVFENIDLTAFKNLLVQGGPNVLAIQGLNVTPGDSDFLVLPELRASTQFQQPATYFTVPTPGAANGSVGLYPGPNIAAVSRPTSGIADNEDLVVTAVVTARSAPISTVTLKYVVNQGSEVALQMFDDGAHGDGAANDGTFGATIPAAAASVGQMVRWCVTALDTLGLTSRAPIHAVADSAVYFGTVVRDPSVTSTLPIFQLFAADTANLTTRTGTRAAVYYNGDFYDNVFVRDRGGNTTDGVKVDFNNDQRFRHTPDSIPRDEINLNYHMGDPTLLRSVLSFDAFQDAGQVSLDASVVRIQLNGTFWKAADYVENVDAQFLDSRGLDGDGTLYKLVTDQPQMQSAGAFEKKTRDTEDNSDLQTFLNGVHQGGQAAINYLYDNFDVDGFMNYWAVNQIVNDTDDIQKNYYLYRDTNGDGKWKILPWDKDLTFGLNFGIANYGAVDPQTHPLLGDHNHPKIDGPSAYNFLTDLILTNPALKQAYLRRLRSVMDEFLQPASTPVAQRYFETKLDALYAQVSGDPQVVAYLGGSASLQANVSDIKTKYLAQRRQHLYVDHSTNTAYPDFAGIPSSQAASPTINIGQVDYNPVSGKQSEEYIRLDNPSATTAVDISGWKLANAVDFTFAPGTVIPAGASLYVAASIKAFLARTTGPHGNQGLHVVGGYDGQLSARGETIELHDANNAVVTTLPYVGSPTPAQLGLRITEIMYHPADPPDGVTPDDDLEYVELQNISGTTLNLSGAKFTQGFDFTFPAGTSLAAGAYGVVVRNKTAFEAKYGVGTANVLGQYTPDVLDNGGERIRLEDASGEVVLDFNYSQDWYPSTDGGGFSLVKIDPTADPSTWGDKAAWRPSGAAGGSPGVVDPVDTTAPTVVSVTFDGSIAPQRVLVKFSEDVSATLATASLSVVRRPASGADVPVAFTLLGYDHATNVATFRVTAGSAGVSAAGVLGNGNYRATLLPAGIHDPAGNALVAGAAATTDFFLLAGDASGNRSVGPEDFNLLATHFGQSGQTWATGDFDGDGIVGPGDFNILATAFGTSLAPPPPGLTATTTTAAATTTTQSTVVPKTTVLGTRTVITRAPTPVRATAKPAATAARVPKRVANDVLGA